MLEDAIDNAESDVDERLLVDHPGSTSGARCSGKSATRSRDGFRRRLTQMEDAGGALTLSKLTANHLITYP